MYFTTYLISDENEEIVEKFSERQEALDEYQKREERGEKVKLDAMVEGDDGFLVFYFQDAKEKTQESLPTLSSAPFLRNNASMNF